MAQQAEQAQLVQSLLGKGYTVRQLAELTQRSPRYITQARDAVVTVGKGGRVAQGKGQNLIPVLRELNTKGQATTTNLPARRQVKGGGQAKVRTGVKNFKTRGGKQEQAVRGRRQSATLKKAISNAGNKGLRWDIKYKKIKTKSGQTKDNSWVTGFLPEGWTAADLMDRINNPESGDSWKAGNVNQALASIALAQNEGAVVSAVGAIEYSLFTID